eukprot:comp21795_c0_seq1/m.30988 comp21795_c0_seq1/g.30988  ORF comp21795_c0_seq1/g.30988 comp21795_c0_seq1/m.30988 type:complete len:611 (-) comp21795_c0_seq1:142-1974(-)
MEGFELHARAMDVRPLFCKAAEFFDPENSLTPPVGEFLDVQTLKKDATALLDEISAEILNFQAKGEKLPDYWVVALKDCPEFHENLGHTVGGFVETVTALAQEMLKLRVSGEAVMCPSCNLPDPLLQYANLSIFDDVFPSSTPAQAYHCSNCGHEPPLPDEIPGDTAARISAVRFQVAAKLCSVLAMDSQIFTEISDVIPLFFMVLPWHRVLNRALVSGALEVCCRAAVQSKMADIEEGEAELLASVLAAVMEERTSSWEVMAADDNLPENLLFLRTINMLASMEFPFQPLSLLSQSVIRRLMQAAAQLVAYHAADVNSFLLVNAKRGTKYADKESVLVVKPDLPFKIKTIVKSLDVLLLLQKAHEGDLGALPVTVPASQAKVHPSTPEDTSVLSGREEAQVTFMDTLVFFAAGITFSVVDPNRNDLYSQIAQSFPIFDEAVTNVADVVYLVYPQLGVVSLAGNEDENKEGIVRKEEIMSGKEQEGGPAPAAGVFAEKDVKGISRKVTFGGEKEIGKDVSEIVEKGGNETRGVYRGESVGPGSVGVGFTGQEGGKLATMCGWCGKGECELKRCSQCMAQSYCSKDCQKRHWNAGHRVECKREAGSTTPAV